MQTENLADLTENIQVNKIRPNAILLDTRKTNHIPCDPKMNERRWQQELSGCLRKPRRNFRNTWQCKTTVKMSIRLLARRGRHRRHYFGISSCERRHDGSVQRQLESKKRHKKATETPEKTKDKEETDSNTRLETGPRDLLQGLSSAWLSVATEKEEAALSADRASAQEVIRPQSRLLSSTSTHFFSCSEAHSSLSSTAAIDSLTLMHSWP